MRIDKSLILLWETCSLQVECDQEIDEEWKGALILCILCNFLFPNCKWPGGWSLEIATSYFLSKPQIMFAFACLDLRPVVLANHRFIPRKFTNWSKNHFYQTFSREISSIFTCLHGTFQLIIIRLKSTFCPNPPLIK